MKTLLIALGALIFSALGLAGVPIDALEAQRDLVLDGQVWRLLTGPLLHTTIGMLARDVAMFAWLGILYERRFGKGYPTLLLAGIVVPTCAVFWLEPHHAAYYGLSGAVNVMFVAGLLLEIRTTRGRAPWWLWVAGAGYLVKLAYETWTGGLLFDLELGSAMAPAPSAHLAGALVGLIAGLWPISATGDALRRRK